MDQIQSFFAYYKNLVPFGLMGFFGLSGAAAIGLLATFIMRGKQAALTKALQGQMGKVPTPVLKRISAFLLEWLNPKKLLIFWEILPAEEMRNSFKQALIILKGYLGSHSYKYKLPWFLSIGAEEAGKTTVLENAGLDLPVAHPEFFDEADVENCKWWFFDRGIVLDITGQFLLERETNHSNEKMWNQLLRLLTYYRSRRPLDGIILSIPCDELTGPKRLSPDEILVRAKKIQTKLWHIQRTLGMRIPVYMMITKCDQIRGFRGFAAELPEQSLNNMLGWSSPYALDVRYSPEWINDAYVSTTRALHSLRNEIFARGVAKENRDDTLIFQVEFEKLFKPLETYTNNIFRESNFHDSFFLRGIYFVGDTGEHTAVSDLRRKELYAIPPEAVGSNVEDPFKKHDNRRISFIKDLFEEKIFKEYALARPISRILVSSNKLLNLYKTAIIVCLVGLFYGLLGAKQSLDTTKRTLYPLVRGIADSSRLFGERKSLELALQDINRINQESIKLLDLMSNIQVEGSKSFFVPPSWFSSYDKKIIRILTAGWNNTILKSLYAGLVKKSQEILFTPASKSYLTDGGNTAINPVSSSNFKDLVNFLQAISNFETHVLLFNDFEKNPDPKMIAKVVKYVYDRDLPPAFFENSDYYTNALKQTFDRDVDLSAYKLPARIKLRELFEAFLQSSLTLPYGFPQLSKTAESFTELSQLNTIKGIDNERIASLLKDIIATTQLITSQAFSWITQKYFNPGPAYVEAMGLVRSTFLFGPQVLRELESRSNSAFNHYKQSLLRLKAPVIGHLLASQEGQLLAAPSASYLEVVDHIKDFQKQPFMSKLVAPRSIMFIPPGQFLMWDETALKAAGELVQSFEEYIGGALPKMQVDLRPILKVVGASNLRTHLFHQISKAQNFQPEPRTMIGFDERESVKMQVANLKTAHPTFASLLGTHLQGDMTGQASRLRSVLLESSYQLLQRINRILQRADLYGVGQDDFRWWDGKEVLGFRAFGVYDLEDMKKYLSAQLEYAQFMALGLAQPVLSFLNLPYLSGEVRNIAIVTKWQRMITQLEEYEKKSPSNSISILEHFLLNDINDVNTNKCAIVVLDEEHYDSTGDFFLDRRNDLRRRMSRRCQEISGGSSRRHYLQVSAFFNSRLKGRFPFVDPKQKKTSDARKEDVRTFLEMMDQMGQTEQKVLLQIEKSTTGVKAIKNFFDQMDTVRPYLIAGLSKEIPNINFQIQFRTDLEREIGGNRIIDWTFKVGDKEALRQQAPQKTGTWRVGEPIQVGFKWASESRVTPAQGANPNLRVKGDWAHFNYKDWGLLRLITEHTRRVLDEVPEGPLTLEFNIPTMDPEKASGGCRARVFIRLGLSLPDPEKGEGATKDLSYPVFPTSAPPLQAHK